MFVKRAPQLCTLIATSALLGFGSLACSETVDGNPSNSTGGMGQTGGSSSGGQGAGGDVPADLSKGGPKLRALTRSEYANSVTDLLGPITTPYELPTDLAVAGFVSVGGAEVQINISAVKLYEAAARAIAAEVFGDAARWQKLVGCQPKEDLSDACVAAFVKSFGKRAFRRDLSDAEAQQWLKVATDGAQLSGSGARGLGNMVAAILQSPFFLYRVETNKLDVASGRLKYDGASMATRLAYLLTGGPPSEALLAAAAAGQLETAEGVKTAAAPLLTDPRAVDRMSEFFAEFSQIELVNVVEKAPALFPEFNDALRASMVQATRLFIKNVVLAPGVDVRTFFDSDQTFVDATLAPIYGVTAPASGFQQIKLGPEAGRAGILGQAGVLAGHAQADHTSPTRRGVFIASTFLCVEPPPPPPGVATTLPDDPNLTERQRLELHRKDPACAACHALFDPYGMALEHLDPIGKYRATERNLPIDATGALDGVNFNGGAEFAAVLRENQRALSCMMKNFYRNANGLKSAEEDHTQVEGLTQLLAAKGYVWRDVVTEFVASEAFRSAPAPVITAGNQ
jgi:hypothetical protein